MHVQRLTHAEPLRLEYIHTFTSKGLNPARDSSDIPECESDGESYVASSCAFELQDSRKHPREKRIPGNVWVFHGDKIHATLNVQDLFHSRLIVIELRTPGQLARIFGSPDTIHARALIHERFPRTLRSGWFAWPHTPIRTRLNAAQRDVIASNVLNVTQACSI